ncbi:MAG TPA: accessory factor UbiK family protein [Xylella taiwanensis]
MIDLNHLDTIASRLTDLVPPALYQSRLELQAVFKDVLQTGLAKLDLVTREEFDIQRGILLSTREKLETLQKTLVILEERLTNQTTN